MITKYDSSYNQYNMNSDSDYDDVGVLPVDGRAKEATNNHARKPSKKNCGGKTVRGGDRQWVTLESFSTSEEFLSSDLQKKIKVEFVKIRNRQFLYALVQEYRCKYAKKSGYLPCPWVLRVIISSTDMGVKVETDGNSEHHHEQDPLRR